MVTLTSNSCKGLNETSQRLCQEMFELILFVCLFQATENAGLKAALEEERRQQNIFSEEMNRLKVIE